MFALQLDESTDVSSCAQVMVCVRYIHKNDFKKLGVYIFNLVNEFIENENHTWQKCCAICTDETHAMLGVNSGFIAHVKQLVPDIIINHCMKHCTTNSNQ